MSSVLRLSVLVIWLSLLSSCGGSSESGGADPNSAGGENPNPPLGGDPQNSNANGFVTFESASVRPLALSDDGSTLYATNTPNSTLDIFSLTESGPSLRSSVAVGMEPVSVALIGEQAWVVNHLSDSVSIVDIAASPPRVIKTLLVGDEPRDIVFAGALLDRAFITTAHRGQNGPDDQPIDAQLTTPGVPRADVWIFDVQATGTSLGGDPVSVVSLFADTPRALAVSPDRSKVYVAAMNSGNRTTAIGENNIAKPGPLSDSAGNLQPDTGLIVQFDGDSWRDDTGSAIDLGEQAYNDHVSFNLPDYDVFVLSAEGSSEVLDRISGVGTTLFNMISNPANGNVYVTNTEALNVNRFEGQGLVSPSIKGNFARSRISVLSTEGVSIRDLNKHLDHTQNKASEVDRRLATAQPMGMAISSDGSTLYVTGFGSQKIIVYDTQALEDDSFDVNEALQVTLPDGGPAGVVLDESRNRLYVLTRFNNSISVIDTDSLSHESSIAMANPEPASVVEGRPFLYNAMEHSSHGDVSCAICHVSGDTDSLAWDLGNPDQIQRENPNEFVNPLLEPNNQAVFHPMKGPMTTQSLRGLANNGPMHWRGDRTGSDALIGESLELAAFKEFNDAFPELLGSDNELSDEQMTAFAEFALEIKYPPNPIRALDNSLTTDQSAGREVYFQEPTTGGVFTCNACHLIDARRGAFGTDGKSTVEGDQISQEFKVPHLRNMYQKVGKFGNSGIFSSTDESFGDQIRGFGFMHDGNMDTLDNFFQGDVFNFGLDAETNNRKRRQIVDFVMVMDTDLAPVVGQQVTLNAASSVQSTNRVDLLLERAALSPRPECDLIAKSVVENIPRGFLFDGVETFQSDIAGESYSYQQLLELTLALDGSVTFTCVPPGSGTWMGIDRDSDGVLDGE